jgi:hypothetical protein
MLNETRDVSVDLRFSHGFVKGIIPQKFGIMHLTNPCVSTNVYAWQTMNSI